MTEADRVAQLMCHRCRETGLCSRISVPEHNVCIDDAPPGGSVERMRAPQGRERDRDCPGTCPRPRYVAVRIIELNDIAAIAVIALNLASRIQRSHIPIQHVDGLIVP